jgi:hypothetical protein
VALWGKLDRGAVATGQQWADLAVEGTSDAAERVALRGAAWEAVLKGESRESAVSRVGSFERGRLPHGRWVRFNPSRIWHELATGGVRVEQVGVNPLWRAVAATGVGG